VKRAASFGGLLRAKFVDMLRRRSRPRRAARRRAASGPVSRSPRILVLVAALVVTLTPQAHGAPEPDPYRPTTATVSSPTPDPHPSSGGTTPTPTRTTAPSPSPQPESLPPTIESTPPPSSTGPEATERAVTKPKPMPNPKTPATNAGTAGQRSRDGNGSIRAAATATSVAASTANAAMEPMILGALALLTLAVSSASLLFVLDRTERQGGAA
jgi:hypothetical protein